ncbi:hypothetical protein NMY22_g6490 [Coprinellus aureogranulatus]|nr:hypothetical protein NMY22_g6490 [Coprinellus aureogranulatus]
MEHDSLVTDRFDIEEEANWRRYYLMGLSPLNLGAPLSSDRERHGHNTFELSTPSSSPSSSLQRFAVQRVTNLLDDTSTEHGALVKQSCVVCEADLWKEMVPDETKTETWNRYADEDGGDREVLDLGRDHTVLEHLFSCIFGLNDLPYGPDSYPYWLDPDYSRQFDSSPPKTF